MTGAYTTHLQPVCYQKAIPTLRMDFANLLIATSGACATIASDALMNPFDGELWQLLHRNQI